MTKLRTAFFLVVLDAVEGSQKSKSGVCGTNFTAKQGSTAITSAAN